MTKTLGLILKIQSKPRLLQNLVDSIFYIKKSSLSLTGKIEIDSFLSFILFANTISPHLMLKYSQFRFNLDLNKTINLDFESHLFH